MEQAMNFPDELTQLVERAKAAGLPLDEIVEVLEAKASELDEATEPESDDGA
jgi:hypothetical protein